MAELANQSPAMPAFHMSATSCPNCSASGSDPYLRPGKAEFKWLCSCTHMGDLEEAPHLAPGLLKLWLWRPFEEGASGQKISISPSLSIKSAFQNKHILRENPVQNSF